MKNFEKSLDIVLEHAAMGTLCFECPANGECPECGKCANRPNARDNCIKYYSQWAKEDVK